MSRHDRGAADHLRAMRATSDRVGVSDATFYCVGDVSVNGGQRRRLIPDRLRLSDARRTPSAAAATAATAAVPAAALVAGYRYRYLKRVGEELHAWSTSDGSGEPSAVHFLPFAGDLTLGVTMSDDVIVIDMGGGDIDILGILAMADTAGADVVRLINGDGRLLTVGGVELGGDKLDLGTSDLIIRDADIDAIEDLLASAYWGSTRWAGPGIGTSSGGPRTGLAPMRQGPEVLVKYTYNGDMTGDERLDADDYFRIDFNFLLQPPKPSYEQGDLNFDDVIDADDYLLIDRAFSPPFDPGPL